MFRHLVLLVVMIVIFTSLGAQAQSDSPPMASVACYADVKADYLAYLRRGPSGNWGIKRHLYTGVDLRVFGQDDTGLWVQVYLERLDMIGWILREHLDFYGRCTLLPVTSDIPEPEEPLAMPSLIPVPDFARNMVFDENEQLYYLNEGILYVRHETPELWAHFIIADLGHPKLDVQVALAATPGVRNGLVSEIAAETGAFVAINGDFYVNNFLPQNLMLIDGEVITAPKHRATFAITEDHQPFIGYFTEQWSWDASITAENGESLPLQLANVPCEDDWVCLYTDFWPWLSLREGYDGLRVLISPEDEVLEIVVNQPLEIPAGHRVLRTGVNTVAARWLRDNLAVGDTIQISLRTEPDWREYEYAIGGGPMIVRDGAFWQDCNPDVSEDERICEDFNSDFRVSHYYRAHIPRSAVGYNPDNDALILIMVEGNGVRDSQGITQQGLADMFVRLGAETAMEFDGGGSASLWVDRNHVNAFREAGERHVSNVLLLFWDD